MKNKKLSPSMDQWLEEAKQDPKALDVGMYLIHNGVVRQTPKQKVRKAIDDGSVIDEMDFSYDEKGVEKAIEKTYKMDGIYYIKVWLNEGLLIVGEDIMYVLIGGDIRPHVIAALEFLVEEIKSKYVTEIENIAQFTD